MRVYFSAPTPRFGRVNNRLHVGYQQRSPYYWWWAYLRRNEDYLACCEAGGKGKLAALYADFGDVRDDDFHKWWTQDNRCIRLFAEQPLTVKFAELASPAEWQPQWTADDAMVLVVPLRVSKRRLKGIFAKMLDQRHTGTRGRPAVASQVSSARYQLQHNYTIQSLQTGLSVYDLWLANQQLGTPDRMTLWELGVKAGLNKKAAKDAVSTLSQDRLVGRNVLAATVSRYVKQANAVIANAGLGLFPLY